MIQLGLLLLSFYATSFFCLLLDHRLGITDYILQALLVLMATISTLAMRTEWVAAWSVFVYAILLLHAHITVLLG